ncbi:endonuclease/exonuclease/phosphatase family protein [Cohnella mopanensis]|uniref:endonuclease/exonuclease/phosphatase family protein n=1 Tax=Cohnella mopanensis TaxID=2911966 RepID=UPI001EF86E3A|nr:endonuclease/exonuclease/phosphatase family protein [Cohnella mopanensis]
MKLTIMTFNLRVNTPIDGDNAWPYRIRHATDLVRKAEPLIIGTQEGRYDMLRDLDQELSDYSRLGEGRSGYESGDPRMDECCAIFYKHDRIKVIKQGQFSLSETPEIPGSVSWDSSYPRFCTWACLERIDEPGRRFYVYNTHFDHEGQLAREESAKLLLDRIARCQEEEGLPVLLTGDFNSFPENPAIVTLRQNLIDAYLAHPEPIGRTFHDFEGGVEGEPIDYLFFTRDVALLETTVYRDEYEGKYPSDHYPISAQVLLP